MYSILTWCLQMDVSYIYSIARTTILKGQWYPNDGLKRKNTESHGKTPSPFFCSYKMDSLVRSKGAWDTIVINNTPSQWQWRQKHFLPQVSIPIRQITVPVTMEGSDVITFPWVSVWSPIQWHGYLTVGTVTAWQDENTVRLMNWPYEEKPGLSNTSFIFVHSSMAVLLLGHWKNLR